MSAAAARKPSRLVERHSKGRVLAESAALPPKPVDPDGRHVAWVLLTRSPGFDYEGRWTDVNAAWIAGQVERYAALTKGGYTAPILAEHTKAITKGERLGDVLTLASITHDKEPALAGALAFACDPEEARRKIAHGRIKFVSPGFGSLRDERGVEHEDVILEVSLVAGPHQKNMDKTHILASEEPTVDNNAAPNPPISLEDRLSAIENALAAITSKMMEQRDQRDAEDAEDESKPITAMGDEPTAKIEEEEPAAPMGEDEDKPEAIEMSEIKRQNAALKAEATALAARVAKVEEERNRAAFRAAYPVGTTITMSEDLVDAFYALSKADAKATRAITSKGVKHAAPTAPIAPLAPSAPFDFGVQMAESASPTEGPDLSTEDGKGAYYSALLAEHKGNAVAATNVFLGELAKRGLA